LELRERNEKEGVENFTTKSFIIVSFTNDFRTIILTPVWMTIDGVWI
jgi:hypothetical protein